MTAQIFRKSSANFPWDLIPGASGPIVKTNKNRLFFIFGTFSYKNTYTWNILPGVGKRKSNIGCYICTGEIFYNKSIFEGGDKVMGHFKFEMFAWFSTRLLE